MNGEMFQDSKLYQAKFAAAHARSVAEAELKQAQKQLKRAQYRNTDTTVMKWSSAVKAAQEKLDATNEALKQAIADIEAASSARAEERRAYFEDLAYGVHAEFDREGIEIIHRGSADFIIRIAGEFTDVSIYGPNNGYFGDAETSQVNWGAYGSRDLAFTEKYIALLGMAVEIGKFIDKHVAQYPLPQR
jgi:hypothetical protein